MTTGVAGILGLPFPNGLIPQAPFHTDSLCVTKVVRDGDDEGGENKGHFSYKRTHVVEQRVSNLAQGLLTLVTMTGPLLVVLSLIPQGVLAGLFFVMGVQALEANGITAKLLFLARDVSLTPGGHPLRQIPRRSAVWAFTIIELLGFGTTFAITQTVAAIGFPIIILLLIPVRASILPRFFTPHELSILDAPTASPFTMESVGGSYGGFIDAPSSGDAGGEEDTADEKGAEGDTGGGLFGSSGSSEDGGVAPGRKSEENLAEMGENKNEARQQSRSGSAGSGSGGVTRRRNSAVGSRPNGSEAVEMRNLDMNRRGRSIRSNHRK